MLETLDYTIRIGSTPTFLYFDLYLYSAYEAHYIQTWQVVNAIRSCPYIILGIRKLYEIIPKKM